jgi:hypothetical protein
MLYRLAVFKRRSARVRDNMAGDKILILNLMILKGRPYKISLKSKFSAWSDDFWLRYEVNSDGRVFWPRQKMVIFRTFYVGRDKVIILNINIIISYTKRKSVFSSIALCTFWLSIHIFMRKKIVGTVTLHWKSGSYFHVFSKYFGSWEQNRRIHIHFMAQEESSWKTASSDVKTSEKKDSSIVEFFEKRSRKYAFYADFSVFS